MEMQRAKLDARIQQLKNKRDAEERKKDTRRKILAGAYLISQMNGDLKHLGHCLHDAGFLRDRDRNLFDI